MRLLICLALALTSAAPAAVASDDHNHEAAVEAAPHGGVLRNAEHLKAEAVLVGDLVKIYIYDKQLKLKPPSRAK